MEPPAGEFQPSRHSREVKIVDWRDAEEFAEWHMREALGLVSARRTGAGADGGIDVVADGFVAQVKHLDVPVGCPDAQRLYGAALGRGCVFYSTGGYTGQCRAYADDAGVALFSMTIYGDVTPENARAQALDDAGPRRAAVRRAKAVREAKLERIVAARQADRYRALAEREKAAAEREAQQQRAAAEREAQRLVELRRRWEAERVDQLRTPEPGQVENLRAQLIKGTLRLSWDPAPGAESYKVMVQWDSQPYRSFTTTGTSIEVALPKDRPPVPVRGVASVRVRRGKKFGPEVAVQVAPSSATPW